MKDVVKFWGAPYLMQKQQDYQSSNNKLIRILVKNTSTTRSHFFNQTTYLDRFNSIKLPFRGSLQPYVEYQPTIPVVQRDLYC